MLEDAALRPLRFTLLIRREVHRRHAQRNSCRHIEGDRRADGRDAARPPTRWRRGSKRASYDAIYDRIEMRDTDPAMNLEFWMSSGAAHVWNPRTTAPPADWERQIDQLMVKNAETFDRIERLQAFVDAQKMYLQHMPAISSARPNANRHEHAHAERDAVAAAATSPVERRKPGRAEIGRAPWYRRCTTAYHCGGTVPFARACPSW